MNLYNQTYFNFSCKAGVASQCLKASKVRYLPSKCETETCRTEIASVFPRQRPVLCQCLPEVRIRRWYTQANIHQLN